MITKYVTSKAVIAKVIADLGLNEEDIKITDIKEWIAEAMLKIGSVNQMDNKVKILKLKDYQTKLPCDLERINFVAYSDTPDKGWVPMKKTTGFFGVNDKIVPTSDKSTNLLNEFVHPRVVQDKMVKKEVQYDVKPGYIFSNIKDGYIKLAYTATYTDEDGMPLIPDNTSYFEALYWYVVMKLVYIDYFTGKKPQHIYYDAKRSWNFYRQQAYAESLLPNSNELENIKNTWHTLVPEFNSYDTFLNTTGDEQIIYNWN